MVLIRGIRQRPSDQTFGEKVPSRFSVKEHGVVIHCLQGTIARWYMFHKRPYVANASLEGFSTGNVDFWISL